MSSAAPPPRPDTAGNSTSGRAVAIVALLIALVAHVLFVLGYLFVLLVGGTTGLEFGVFLVVAGGVGWLLLWLVIAIIGGRAPPRRALLGLIVPLADVLIVILLTTGTLGGSCSDQELAIIDAIPQYPGTTATFDYESQSGSCAGTFDVEASPEDVVEHYRRELERDGWTVAIQNIPTGAEGEPVTSMELAAQRDGELFTIALESSSGHTSVAIRVDAG